MASLPNFPMVSQRSTITSDGRPSENADFDCVPAAIGAGLLWYLGRHQWDQEINPDLMKDKEYGEALHNSGTAAIKYVPFCAALGIKLYSIDGNPSTLIEQAHKHIQDGHPVIFTEPSPYCSVYQRETLGWTHVCTWFEEAPGHLTAMDPFIAKPIEKSDAEWMPLLRFNQIWILERITPVNVLPPGWHDDGATLQTASGELVLGFRAHVLALLLAGKWNPANQPLGRQYYTKQLEASNPLLGDGDQIILTEGMLGYPHNPQAPYEGLKNKVIEEYVGTELKFTREQVAKYYAAATQAQAQVTQLQSQLAQLQQPNPDALAAIHQVQQVVAPFK